MTNEEVLAYLREQRVRREEAALERERARISTTLHRRVKKDSNVIDLSKLDFADLLGELGNELTETDDEKEEKQK